MSTFYKSFEIEPEPLRDPNTQQWSISVIIYKHKGHSVINRQFTGKNTFKTEKEAIDHSIDFGKQIIDGKYHDFSVSDM